MQPIFSTVKLEGGVGEILLDCGMNIVECSANVHQTCKLTLQEFNEISPSMVSEFFKTNGKFSVQSIMPTLPKKLKETPLKNSQNIVVILKYFIGDSETVPDLSDMQLLVTIDEVLRCYSLQMPVFNTRNFDLIPAKKNLFVDYNIMNYFETKKWEQASLKKFELNNFFELLPAFLEEDKWFGPHKKVPIDNESHEMIKWIAKVWTFIGKCLDVEDDVVRQNCLQSLSAIHNWCLFPVLEKKKSTKSFVSCG